MSEPSSRIRRHVRELHGLAVERHVHDAERRDGAVWQLDRLAVGHADGRAGTARRARTPSHTGQRWPMIFFRGDALQVAARRVPGGVGEVERGRRADALTGSTSSQRGSGRVMSLMRSLLRLEALDVGDVPSRSSRHTGSTRMPVLMASSEPASTACSIAVSAPSSLMSAKAKGRSSGCPARGGAPTPRW